MLHLLCVETANIADYTNTHTHTKAHTQSVRDNTLDVLQSTLTAT